MEDKERKPVKVNRNVIIISVILVIILMSLITIFLKNFTNITTNSEQAMMQLVEEYYERDIKGKVIGINRQKVTLDALEKAGFDISKVTNNNNYDKMNSYSLVIIENPNETDPSKIVYRIENHLNGI